MAEDLFLIPDEDPELEEIADTSEQSDEDVEHLARMVEEAIGLDLLSQDMSPDDLEDN
jgi:hypothetical protein